MKKLKGFLLPALILWLCAGAGAGDAFGAEVIVEMQARGNTKVESDAILTILESKKGQALDPGTVRDDIRALYDLGFFSDIRFFKVPVAGGIRLVVEVKEKPSIMEIQFSGLEELSEEDFKEKLETRLYTIVNESTITQDLRMIEQQYLEKGFYLAKATYKLEPKPGNEHEVVLKFIIDEKGKILVADLRIIGNEYFSDAEIIDKFVSKPLTRSSTFATPGSVYNDDYLKRDLEFMSFLYKDQGFAEVKVAKPIVIMDQSRRYVRATFEVEEGIQYHVGGIEVSGDILYPKEQLKNWMVLKPGALFRFSQFRRDVEMLYDKYGDKGYAFVDVNPIHKFDRAKKLVYLNYKIDKGEKVYFGHMTIVGNTKTRDNVIRRELEVADSELYSGTGLTRSKKNIERLGFFEEVQTIKERDPVETYILNYKFKVKEKPTGQLQAALGFSPGSSSNNESNWFGQGRYNEENQSGKGWKTNVTGRWNGGNNYSLELGWTDPRVNDSRWSLGFSAFWRNEVRLVTDGVSVQEKRVGGSVTVGRRIIELIRGAVTYRYSRITQDSDAYLLERFKEEGVASSLIFALSRDATNNYLDPSEGTRARISQKVTGGPLLGGDRQFFEFRVDGQWYLPIDMTETYRTYFRLHGNLGILYPYGGKSIPFFDRYRFGGPDDLRGYRYRSIGPRFNILQAPNDSARSVVYGGNRALLFQLEYFFPIIPDANIKGLLFTDAGRIYDDSEDMELNGFKRDVGFGFRWLTPIAPFRFEWAYPYENGELGDLEFIFSLGFQ